MKQIILIFLTWLILSCHSDDKKELILQEGVYTGTFKRTSPTTDWSTANVTLTFADNSFEGESDTEKYPAICSGTYEISGDEIHFENECPWTADFDWTFVLNGQFQIEVQGNELTLTHTYDDNSYDQYVLTKE